MLRLACAAVAVLSCVLNVRAQEPAVEPSAVAPSAVTPSAAAPSATMFATERYLFVLRGDQLLQFEIDSLRLLHRATLPAPAGARPARRAAGAERVPEPAEVPSEEVVEEEVVEIEAEEFEEVVEEPVLQPFEVEDDGPDRQVHAGGRYGGREAGNERLAQRGGRASATAIQLALDWLARHQSADGRWDADAFMANEAGGVPTDGAGIAVHDVGVTGLALLAMLGDGNTLRAGPYREHVKRGIAWLRGQQDPKTGLIGTAASHTFIYDHAIASLAMVEAYGLSDYRLLRSNAQRAIDYLEWHRNPYMVWRYQPRDGDNDTSVTTWCVMAYAAARDFGLTVNQQVFQLALTWLDQVTDPASGRTGYTDRGGFSSRLVGEHATLYPREANEAMTAAGLYCRFLLGQTPAEHPIMTTQADLVIGKPPRWDQKAGTIDEYGWFLGTMALYQMGGRYWKNWERHLHDAVVKTQRQDGNFAGSWDPVGVWGQVGGRVFSTAMLCLTLEAYYRTTKLVR